MPRTIAALFDDRGKAEGALQALLETGIAGHQSALLACREAHGSELAPGRTVSPDHARFSAALRELGLPEGDTAEFEEAVRRGGCMLSVRVESGTIDKAIALVEAFDPVDLDRRAVDWRRSGVGPGPGAGVDVGSPLGAGLTAGAGPGASNTAALPGMAGMAQSTHDVGSADLRTRDVARFDQGSSARATGGTAPEERADAPGTLELRYRRDTNRTGRVRAYAR
ncbi:MAG TPA: hypothetical protein VF601_12065 [Beijerinckiaceae bacterium]